VVEVLRIRHCSRRTEQACIHWIRGFIRFHGRLQDGYDIRTLQELLLHKDIKAAMAYTHVLNRGGQGVHSPLDRLRGGSRSRAGDYADRGVGHKMPETNKCTHRKSLHRRRLRSLLGIGTFSLCRPGGVL